MSNTFVFPDEVCPEPPTTTPPPPPPDGNPQFTNFYNKSNLRPQFKFDF